MARRSINNMTRENVADIKLLLAVHVSKSRIAEMFNVPIPRITYIDYHEEPISLDRMMDIARDAVLSGKLDPPEGYVDPRGSQVPGESQVPQLLKQA